MSSQGVEALRNRAAKRVGKLLKLLRLKQRRLAERRSRHFPLPPPGRTVRVQERVGARRPRDAGRRQRIAVKLPCPVAGRRRDRADDARIARHQHWRKPRHLEVPIVPRRPTHAIGVPKIRCQDFKRPTVIPRMGKRHRRAPLAGGKQGDSRWNAITGKRTHATKLPRQSPQPANGRGGRGRTSRCRIEHRITRCKGKTAPINAPSYSRSFATTKGILSSEGSPLLRLRVFN
jgi:hypothetical protein